MKLIGKMAREYAESGNHFCPNEQDIARAFQDGFRACVDMALQANAWPDEKYRSSASGFENTRHIQVHEAIKDLGESEVE